MPYSTTMDSLLENGRSLPIYALAPGLVAALGLLIYALRSSSGAATRFVVFAIWLRVVLSALHSVTFLRSPAGLSYNALGSILVCGVGLLVLRKRRASDIGLIPFYPLFGAILVSGVLNHVIPATVDMFVKYLYMAIVTLAVVDALDEAGWDRALSKIFLPCLILMGFQALSVILGVVKASEADGSASYIGGYNHEAAFSVALCSALVLLAMRQNMRVAAKLGLTAMLVIGIGLANYRTAMIAILPIVGAMAVLGSARSVIPSQRAFVVGLAIVAAGVAGVALFSIDADRFVDVGTVLRRGVSLIQEPRQFDLDDRHLLSGRALIWSQYLYGYAESKPLQHLIGLGPNAWAGVMIVYAHNTLISALYELGAFGLGATLFLWTWMLALALLSRTPATPILIACHVGFLLLNMATMPLWQIEGMILYGCLCGCTIQAYRITKRQAVGAAAFSPSRANAWRTYRA